MTDKTKFKPIYEAPVVIPLGSLETAAGAACKSGGGDTGACKTGFDPGGACNTGPAALKNCVDGAGFFPKHEPGPPGDSGSASGSSEGKGSGFRVP